MSGEDAAVTSHIRMAMDEIIDGAIDRDHREQELLLWEDTQKTFVSVSLIGRTRHGAALVRPVRSAA